MNKNFYRGGSCYCRVGAQTGAKGWDPWLSSYSMHVVTITSQFSANAMNLTKTLRLHKLCRKDANAKLDNVLIVTDNSTSIMLGLNCVITSIARNSLLCADVPLRNYSLTLTGLRIWSILAKWLSRADDNGVSAIITRRCKFSRPISLARQRTTSSITTGWVRCPAEVVRTDLIADSRSAAIVKSVYDPLWML